MVTSIKNLVPFKVPERFSSKPPEVAAPIRERLSPDDAYQELTDRLASYHKYPELHTVFSDPSGFTQKINARFEAQKAITPEDPYQFSFGDYAMPVIKNMKDAVTEKLATVRAMQAEHEATPAKAWRRGVEKVPGGEKLTAKVDDASAKLRGRVAAVNVLRPRYTSEDYSAGIELLEKLETELAGLVEKNDVTYRRFLELSRHTSIPLGYFDYKGLKLGERLMLEFDRAQAGWVRNPITEDLENYDTNGGQIFDKLRPGKLNGITQTDYEASINNPDQLEAVVLPTMSPLGEFPFMRTLGSRLVMEGVTPSPLGADGFNRPGEDFWKHDVNHNASIVSRYKDYLLEKKYTPENFQKLLQLTDQWLLEFNDALDQVQDPGMKRAIQFFHFNTHHDRGIPMVPSSYTQLANREFPPVLVHSLMRMAHQTESYGKWYPQALLAAQKWNTNFWLPRLAEEQALWGGAEENAPAPGIGLGWHAVG